MTAPLRWLLRNFPCFCFWKAELRGMSDEETPLLRDSAMHRGATVSFHHVAYTVRVSPPGKLPCTKISKEILHDIRSEPSFLCPFLRHCKMQFALSGLNAGGKSLRAFLWILHHACAQLMARYAASINAAWGNNLGCSSFNKFLHHIFQCFFQWHFQTWSECHPGCNGKRKDVVSFLPSPSTIEWWFVTRGLATFGTLSTGCWLTCKTMHRELLWDSNWIWLSFPWGNGQTKNGVRSFWGHSKCNFATGWWIS